MSVFRTSTTVFAEQSCVHLIEIDVLTSSLSLTILHDDMMHKGRWIIVSQYIACVFIQVYAWGDNDAGQCVGSEKSVVTPKLIQPLGGITFILITNWLIQQYHLEQIHKIWRCFPNTMLGIFRLHVQCLCAAGSTFIYLLHYQLKWVLKYFNQDQIHMSCICICKS